EEVLVRDAPLAGLGGDLVLLGHREDRVGPADRPALGPRHRSRLLSFAAWAALVDPGQQRLAVLLAEAAVVGEPAGARVGVPGGHAPLLDDLADHRRPGRHVVVAQERHRPDLSGAVALLTVPRHDRRDVLDVRQRPGLLRLRGPRDDAAGDWRLRDTDIFA